MNKKNILIIIILILLLLGAGFLYFYLKDFKLVEQLTDYMPKETVFYTQFDLKNENLAEFYQNNFRAQTRFEGLMRELNFLGQLSKYLIEEANKIALLVVGQNDEWHKVWLVKADNIHRLNALLPVDFYSSILDAKTLALSENKDVLKLIKEIDPLIEHSKEQRQILNKFSDQNFINIYLAGAYLEFLSTQPDATYNLILNNLDLDFEQPAFLGLIAQENKIVYNFTTTSQSENDFKNFSSADKDVLLNLLNNQNLFGAFFIANLKDAYAQLEEKIISQHKKEEWSQKYEFDWQEIEDLLEQPGVIFSQSKEPKVSHQDLFDFKKYNYGLIIKTNFDEKESLEKIAWIKKIVKNILAFKYPVEKVKRLPDGTQSTELVADAEQFKFEKDDKLEFIEHKDYRFVLSYRDGYLIMGNSKGLIESILKSEDSGEEVVCELFTGQEMAVINSGQLVHGLLSYVDQTIINLKQDGREVSLRGCLLW